MTRIVGFDVSQKVTAICGADLIVQAKVEAHGNKIKISIAPCPHEGWEEPRPEFQGNPGSRSRQVDNSTAWPTGEQALACTDG